MVLPGFCYLLLVLAGAAAVGGAAAAGNPGTDLAFRE